MKQVSQFLKEVNIELSRVEWPSFQEFIGSTLVTLILVVFFTVYFFLVDTVLHNIINKILY